MASAKKTKLVIGIDFGTTFSGVSFLFCKDGTNPGEPEVVTHWLSTLAQNSDRHKVPSTIYYDKATGNVHWGYNIPEDAEPLQWFKLLLLEDADVPAHIREAPHVKAAHEMILKLGKTPVEVVGDYLGQLWTHIIQEIEDANSVAYVRGNPIQVVITVPAIWKDYARDRMRQAARHAGILTKRLAGETTLAFISEPEAAAMATLPDFEKRENFCEADTFVLCDCGGGTVDIISYKFENVTPMEVSECVEGDGALCGATFLDEEFLAFMKKTVGASVWANMDCADIAKMINRDWEHAIKKDFDGTPRTWVVDIPKRRKRGQLKLKQDEIAKIFGGVVKQIQELVSKQVDAIKAKTRNPPKFIILVGGFGRNPYIYKSLKDKFGADVDVLQSRGDRSWNAICRGAALYGAMGHGLVNQAVHVRSRISRLNYGWVFQTPFVKGLHKPADKIWDGLGKRYMAGRQLEWGLLRGQDISAQQPQSFPYQLTFGIDECGKTDGSLTLFSSSLTSPPSRMGDAGWQAWGKIEFEIPTRIENLPIFKSKTASYRKFTLELKLEVTGSSLDITVIADGCETGAKTILVDCN